MLRSARVSAWCGRLLAGAISLAPACGSPPTVALPADFWDGSGGLVVALVSRAGAIDLLYALEGPEPLRLDAEPGQSIHLLHYPEGVATYFESIGRLEPSPDGRTLPPPRRHLSLLVGEDEERWTPVMNLGPLANVRVPAPKRCSRFERRGGVEVQADGRLVNLWPWQTTDLAPVDAAWTFVTDRGRRFVIDSPSGEPAWRERSPAPRSSSTAADAELLFADLGGYSVAYFYDDGTWVLQGMNNDEVPPVGLVSGPAWPGPGRPLALNFAEAFFGNYNLTVLSSMGELWRFESERPGWTVWRSFDTPLTDDAVMRPRSIQLPDELLIVEPSSARYILVSGGGLHEDDLPTTSTPRFIALSRVDGFLIVTEEGAVLEQTSALDWVESAQFPSTAPIVSISSPLMDSAPFAAAYADGTVVERLEEAKTCPPTMVAPAPMERFAVIASLPQEGLAFALGPKSPSGALSFTFIRYSN